MTTENLGRDARMLAEAATLFHNDADEILRGLRDVTEVLHKLVELLSSPSTRVATMQLPTGGATMTVTESR